MLSSGTATELGSTWLGAAAAELCSKVAAFSHHESTEAVSWLSGIMRHEASSSSSSSILSPFDSLASFSSLSLFRMGPLPLLGCEPRRLRQLAVSKDGEGAGH